MRRPLFPALAAVLAGLLLPALLLPGLAHAVPLPAPELEARWQRAGGRDAALAPLRAARERGLFDVEGVSLDSADGRAKRQVWRALVILVDFDDHPADGRFNGPEFDQMIFSEGSFPTGSMRDFYLENSYGGFSLVGDVVGWYRMPHPLSYYSNSDGVGGTGDDYGFGAYPNNARRLYEDAVAAADPDVDYSLYTNGNGSVRGIFIVHSGEGAEATGNPDDIWSHQSSASVGTSDGVNTSTYIFMPELLFGQMSTVGVFCHEFGHVLNLPDLYDTDYSSRGLGRWSLMAGGSWNSNGTRPAHYDPWCKAQLGFLVPEEVTSNRTGELLAPAENQSRVLKIQTTEHSSLEYLLVENRQQTGFDDALPGQGLLVYHVDDDVSSNSQENCAGVGPSHPIVRLLQADGLCELENDVSSGDPEDPFPGAMNVTEVGSITTPSTRTYAGNKSGVRLSNIATVGSDIQFDLQLDEVILARIGLDFPDLQSALDVTGNGDEVKIPAGQIDTGKFTARGGVRISGGWDPSFTAQDSTAPSVLVGQPTAPVLRVLPGSAPAELDNLVIRGGLGYRYYTPSEGWRGGGIEAEDADLIVRRTRFENNEAGFNDNLPSTGGAISMINGALEVYGCSFAGNRAKNGGEIHLSGGSLRVEDSRFEGSTLYVPILTETQRGAAIFVSNAPATIRRSTFRNYSGADEGGALYVDSLDSLVLEDVAIDSCQVDQSAAALYARANPMILRRVDMADNSGATLAGAAYFQGAPLVWEGGTVARNTASILGGGVQIDGVTAGSALRGVVFDRNQASLGGGLYMVSSEIELAHLTLAGNVGTTSAGAGQIASSTARFEASIVAGNSTGLIWSGTAPVALDENIWWDNGGSDLSGAAKGPADLDTDPLFVDAAAGDLHLGPDSPGIDSASGVPDFDGSAADRGAYGGSADRGERPARLLTVGASVQGDGSVDLSWSLDTLGSAADSVRIRGAAGQPAPATLPVVATVAASDALYHHPTPTPGEVWTYRLQPIDAAGHAGSAVEVDTAAPTAAPTPRAFRVGEATPNPFNPRTQVTLSLPATQRVRAELLDLRGRRLRTILDRELAAGEHRLIIDGQDARGRAMGSGVYLLRIVSTSGTAVRRLVLVR